MYAIYDSLFIGNFESVVPVLSLISTWSTRFPNSITDPINVWDDVIVNRLNLLLSYIYIIVNLRKYWLSNLFLTALNRCMYLRKILSQYEVIQTAFTR